MLNLGNLIYLLIVLALVGLSYKELKDFEFKMAKVAVESHKIGYISIQDFHKRLVEGK